MRTYNKKVISKPDKRTYNLKKEPEKVVIEPEKVKEKEQKEPEKEVKKKKDK